LLEFAWEGANTKRIHLGRASQLGLESALLAKSGFSGPSTVLEGRYGYYNAFSLPPNMERLLDGIGQRWAVHPLSLKSFATHVTHQPIVQAIQQFKQGCMFDPARVSRVVIKGDKHIMEDRHAVRDPKSIMGAQYSLPFTTAVALARDMSNPLVYDEGALWDPAVRDLATRVDLVPVEGSSSPELLITLDGETHTLPAPPCKGSPRNPFTWNDACDKFLRYAANAIRKKKLAPIIEAVETLDGCKDMAAIASLVTAR
jgi:2-methylcitrate dehydratase PrpD